jgi:hypothetical protein
MSLHIASQERLADVICIAFAAWTLSNDLYPQAAFLFALALLPNRDGASR